MVNQLALLVDTVLRYLRITFALQLLTMGRLVTTAVTNHNALRVGLKPQSLAERIVLLSHITEEAAISIASIAACQIVVLDMI